MGSMNFSMHPLAAKYSEWKFDGEREYLANSDSYIFRNTFRDIALVARELGEGEGVKFQNECYDVGHLYNLKFCIDTGMFKPPVFIQFVLGNQGASAQIETISFHEAHRRSAVWRWLSLVGTRRCVADGLGGGRRDNGRQCVMVLRTRS